MEKMKIHHRGFLIFRNTLLMGVFLIPVFSFAYNATKTQSFSATAVVEGTANSPFGAINILHNPLPGVSLVTKTAVIQGMAGTNPKINPAGLFSASLDGAKPKANGKKVTVKLEFRFVPENESPDSPNIQISSLPPLTGDDPFPFAFQIVPSSISVGNLQYRLIAEKFDVTGRLEARFYYPKRSGPTGQNWITVTVRTPNSASQVFGAQGGRFTVPDGNPNDGESSINIPAGVLQEGSVVALNEVPLDSSDIPSAGTLANAVAMYQFNSEPRVNGQFKMSLQYPDFIFQYGTNGQDGIIDGTQFSENTAQIFAWDGFVWKKIGGKVDPATNSISIQTGYYNYFSIVAGAGPLTAVERRPLEKIFTPNGDGDNDSVTFNLSDTTTKVEIFDISGHKIRSLSAPGSTVWDGKDDSGQTVESGVYLYQYKVDGQLVSGAIGVAK